VFEIKIAPIFDDVVSHFLIIMAFRCVAPCGWTV
jgi:hypothetical protein